MFVFGVRGWVRRGDIFLFYVLVRYMLVGRKVGDIAGDRRMFESCRDCLHGVTPLSTLPAHHKPHASMSERGWAMDSRLHPRGRSRCRMRQDQRAHASASGESSVAKRQRPRVATACMGGTPLPVREEAH